jgi:hypothetical protein
MSAILPILKSCMRDIKFRHISQKFPLSVLLITGSVSMSARRLTRWCRSNGKTDLLLLIRSTSSNPFSTRRTLFRGLVYKPNSLCSCLPLVPVCMFVLHVRVNFKGGLLCFLSLFTFRSITWTELDRSLASLAIWVGTMGWNEIENLHLCSATGDKVGA